MSDPREGTERPDREASGPNDGTPGPESAALVGAAGGAGTTRLTVEVGAILARDGARVAAFDAALDTQGMADYVESRVSPDATDLMTDEAVSPAAAMTECSVPGGELHLCPARASFGDLARAKAPEAARRLEATLRDAGEAFDRVLVDVPPLASNPAVSAVRAADRVAVVAPPASRGTDAVQRIRGRLKDVGTRADVVVANRGDPDGLDADAAVPEGPSEVAAAPTTADGDGAFAAGVGDVAETLFECDLGVDFESGGLLERVR